MPAPSFYEGLLPNGNTLQSLRPKVFRVAYARRICGRHVNVDKYMSGHDEDSLRARIKYSDPHGEIRGDITVEYVSTLTPIYKGGN